MASDLEFNVFVDENNRVLRSSGSESSEKSDGNDKTYVPANYCGSSSSDESSAEADDPATLNNSNSETVRVAFDTTHENIVANNSQKYKKKVKYTKRKYAEPDMWIKNKRKKLRNSGKDYKSCSGKAVPGKNFIDYDCKCRRKCQTLVSTADRRACYETFYKNGSWETQTAFIAGSVKICPVKQRVGMKAESSRRQESREYFLKTSSQGDIQVCKKMFVNTLRVDSARIHRALQKSTSGNFVDCRGRHVPGNKLSNTSEKNIEDHINSFPRYSSHYTREKNPHCKYLGPGLNLCMMYRLYHEECKEKNVEPVSQSSYERVFRKSFNLKFKAPQKDTCKTCDSLSVQIKASAGNPEQEKKLKHDLSLHHARVKAANDSKKRDIQLAKNSEIEMLTFDLQKTLPLPKIPTNEVYYKRQLSVYNLGIHECKGDKAVMHIWHEGIASRGPDEIVSCLLNYLTSNNINSKHLILWSDSTGGQNRNIKMTAALMYVVQKDDIPIDIIEQKFPVVGHTYLPNDSDFGHIEKRLKYNNKIYTLQEYQDIIRECRPRKEPYKTKIMLPENFISTAPILSLLTKRKTTTVGDTALKVEWLRMRVIRVEKSKPGIMMFKYTHNDDMEFYEVNFNKRLRGKPFNLSNALLPTLYPTGHTISQAKKNDIISLLKYIPPINHQFYQQLVTTEVSENASDEDIDGVELAFDEEDGNESD